MFLSPGRYHLIRLGLLYQGHGQAAVYGVFYALKLPEASRSAQFVLHAAGGRAAAAGNGLNVTCARACLLYTSDAADE